MSKHTKAGRRERRTRYHTALAREAWEAHQGRKLARWLLGRPGDGAAWFARMRAEGRL